MEAEIIKFAHKPPGRKVSGVLSKGRTGLDQDLPVEMVIAVAGGGGRQEMSLRILGGGCCAFLSSSL